MSQRFEIVIHEFIGKARKYDSFQKIQA